MSQLLEFEVKVLVPKGAVPSVSELRKPGGPLEWLPADVKFMGPAEQRGETPFDRILNYRFVPIK